MQNIKFWPYGGRPWGTTAPMSYSFLESSRRADVKL